jgi:hypothetical protein
VDDLVAFLNARLDEDEEKTKQVEPNQAPVQLRAMVTRGGSQPFLVIDADRVLADIESKRRVIEEHRPAWQEGNPDDTYRSPDDAKYCLGCHASFQGEWFYEVDECPTKRFLAVPYADHPDYREEWRP